MRLHDPAPMRAIHVSADDGMSPPAPRPSGRAARFFALLRAVLDGAVATIGHIPSRPGTGSRAGPGSSEAADAVLSVGLVRLGRGARGVRGTVVRVGAETGAAGGIAAAELERRLLEIGFVEGAAVEILHEGFIRRDPIAVRLDDMRVVLRRRDADAIVMRVLGKSASLADAGG